MDLADVLRRPEGRRWSSSGICRLHGACCVPSWHSPTRLAEQFSSASRTGTRDVRGVKNPLDMEERVAKSDQRLDSAEAPTRS